MNPIISLALTAAEYIIMSSSAESEEDSSEEESLALRIIRKKCKRKPSRINNYLETTIANYTSKEF
jgi:hypothetical protein